MKTKTVLLSLAFFLIFLPGVFSDCSYLNNVSMIGYYSFDVNCTADDKGTNTGTNTGVVNAAGGKLNNACDWEKDDTNDRIEINSILTGMPATNTNTMCAWVKRESDWGCPLEGSDNNAAGKYYGFYFGGSTNIIFSTLGSDSLNSGFATQTGWHFVCIGVDADGKIQRAYVNGTSVGTFTTAKELNVIDVLTLGNHADGLGGWDCEYDGMIDEVSFYNYLLSETDIQNLYNSHNACNPLGCNNIYANTTRVNITCLSSDLMNQSYVTYDSANCGNYTNTTYYIADQYCLYDSGISTGICDFTETNEKIDNLQGDFEMIGYVLLWLGLWIFGYYAFNTNNEFLGIIMICLTIPLDIYFSILFFQEGAATKLIGIAFDIVAVVTLAVIPLLKRKIRTKA